MKGAINRGRRPDLFFYRDSKGNEVALLVRGVGGFFPSKSSPPNPSPGTSSGGFEHFKALGLPRTARGLLLSNGEPECETEGLRISNPFALDRDLSGTSSPGLPPLLRVFGHLKIPIPSLTLDGSEDAGQISS